METPRLPKNPKSLLDFSIKCMGIHGTCDNILFFNEDECPECGWYPEIEVENDLKIIKEHRDIMKEWNDKINNNDKDKLYWYYLVWTMKDDIPIEKIYDNMCKLYNRAETLGIYYMDITYEETDLKTNKKIRPHYNMRIKATKYLKKHRDLKNYLKYGNIHLESINKFAKRNKLNINEAWDKCGNYIDKENDIEIWLQ